MTESRKIKAAYADLHIHTNHSDGVDAPAKVVERAHALGLAAIAITDHDTVAGVPEAKQAAYEREIEFLAAVEISASFGRGEIHVVGLGIDPASRPLCGALEHFRAARRRRAARMLEKLAGLGINIDIEEVAAQAEKGGALGRVHIAALLQARGVTGSVQEGFDRYLRAGRRAYVPKEMPACREAIDLIHAARGVAILAHPGIGPAAWRLLPRLMAQPFDGIEVYHPKHTPAQITYLTQLALDRDCLISGGSDFHGMAMSSGLDIGKICLPYWHFERIKGVL